MTSDSANARDEAQRRWPAKGNPRTPSDWLDEGMASGFVLGARWVEAEVRVRERAAAEKAWDEGLLAGSDRWQDAREFGDKPVNPYREEFPDVQ